MQPLRNALLSGSQGRPRPDNFQLAQWPGFTRGLGAWSSAQARFSSSSYSPAPGPGRGRAWPASDLDQSRPGRGAALLASPGLQLFFTCHDRARPGLTRLARALAGACRGLHWPHPTRSRSQPGTLRPRLAASPCGLASLLRRPQAPSRPSQSVPSPPPRLVRGGRDQARASLASPGPRPNWNSDFGVTRLARAEGGLHSLGPPTRPWQPDTCSSPCMARRSGSGCATWQGGKARLCASGAEEAGRGPGQTARTEGNGISRGQARAAAPKVCALRDEGRRKTRRGGR